MTREAKPEKVDEVAGRAFVDTREAGRLRPLQTFQDYEVTSNTLVFNNYKQKSDPKAHHDGNLHLPHPRSSPALS